MDDQRRLVYVRLETAGKLTQAKTAHLDLTKLLPATARKLQFDPGQSFAGNRAGFTIEFAMVRNSPQRFDCVLSIVVWCGVLPHHHLT